MTEFPSFYVWIIWDFPGGVVVKKWPANEGVIRDNDSIPESRRSPRGGHGNPLQHSCLANPMDRGDWRAIVQRITKSQTKLQWFSMPCSLYNHILFIHSAIDGYLGYFHVLAIVNKAAMNMGVQQWSPETKGESSWGTRLCIWVCSGGGWRMVQKDCSPGARRALVGKRGD